MKQRAGDWLHDHCEDVLVAVAIALAVVVEELVVYGLMLAGLR